MDAQPAEHAVATWDVQPMRPPVAEPDLEQHDHEQPDTDTRQPGSDVASRPQDDRCDGLDSPWPGGKR